MSVSLDEDVEATDTGRWNSGGWCSGDVDLLGEESGGIHLKGAAGDVGLKDERAGDKDLEGV